MTVNAVPLRFPSMPAVVGLVPVELDEANALLEQWGHYLGPVNRPFRSEAWALDLDDSPIAVAVGASAVSDTAAGYPRAELVELARLASAERWATRVMLRLWREVAAPRYRLGPGHPAPRAAIAYSQNARHEGNIYRFDGWTMVTDRAGSSGGGTWSSARGPDDTAHGRKRLWLWPLEDATMRVSPER
jgi:hypothetical protein